jgi:PhnB protein
MAVKPIPEGFTAVTPYLIIKDPDAVIAFARAAFGATLADEHRGPDGRIAHADILIGGAHVMMGGATDKWPEMKGSILVYVPAVDATYRAALAAGATSVFEPADQFYGDRSCGVVDAAGVTWWISTRVEDVSPEEIARRMKEQKGEPA